LAQVQGFARPKDKNIFKSANFFCAAHYFCPFLVFLCFPVLTLRAFGHLLESGIVPAGLETVTPLDRSE
jgi:hypothetical protein